MKDSGDDMRILFFTQDDPFYVKLFFDEFFRNCRDGGAVEGVVICDVMGKKSFPKLLKQMYDFYGPVDFTRMGARYVGSKVGGALPAMVRGERSFNIEQLCAGYGIPVLRGNGLHSPAFLSKVRSMKADLFVSVASPVIFRKELIEAARLGCINIHSGKLPRYRGMMPNFWQLYHGEKKVGITVHEINEKIDDGRIILQRDVEVQPRETLDSLMGRTKRIGAHCVADAIRSGDPEDQRRKVDELIEVIGRAER